MWVKKLCGYAGHYSKPKSQQSTTNISFYLHNINNWRAHESQMNCYSNNNKTKLNKTICISYGIYCVCSNGSIKSQRSLLLTWNPFDASPITKPFMISVRRARRPATIPWAIILESSASRLKLGHPGMNCHVCPGATFTERDRQNHHWDFDMDK